MACTSPSGSTDLSTDPFQPAREGPLLDPITNFFVDAGTVAWEALAPGLRFFATSFLSVLIGALPFVVVAVFASAFLEVFVSRETLVRFIPRNPLLGVLLAPLAGLLIPMCECGIVPVARRLVAKGAPLPVAIAFMLANPILNPLVILSTRLAFPNAPHLVWWRVGLGYGVAVGAAAILALVARRPGPAYLLSAGPGWAAYYDGTLLPVAPIGEGACDCGHDHGRQSRWERIWHLFSHAGDEFFSVGRYFIVGAFLAALAQTFISRNLLEAVGQGPVLSVVTMMAFAFLLSICSEADAFVAATFASTFSPGSLLAFMVFGPMSDVKNTMMMLSVFQRGFVVALNGILILLSFSAGYLANMFL